MILEQVVSKHHVPTIEEQSVNFSPSSHHHQDSWHQRIRIERPTTKAAVLGSAFFLIFSCYNVLQNLTSTLLPAETAFWLLGIIYLVFGITNIFLPSWLIARIGSKYGLIVGVGPYLVLSIVYTVCNFKYSTKDLEDPTLTPTLNAIYWPVAAFLGIGASVLWTSQGSYLSLISDTTNMGTLSGLFFGISLLNGVFGCLLSAWMLSANADKGALFASLTVLAALGAFILALLPQAYDSAGEEWIEPNDSAEAVPEVETTSESLLNKVNSTMSDVGANIMYLIRLHGHIGIAWVIPLFYCSGVSQAFSSGTVPLIVTRMDMSEASLLALRLYLLSAFSAANALGSLIVGRWSDKLGSNVLLTLNAATQGIAMLLLSFSYSPNLLGIAFLSSILLGISDAMITTQTFSIINKFLKRHSGEKALIPACFSLYKFHQSLGAALMFVASKSMMDEQGFPLIRTVWLPLICILVAISLMGIVISNKYRE